MLVVETQNTTTTQNLNRARADALFSLNVAIGELQKYTGPDQRVTAEAVILTDPIRSDFHDVPVTQQRLVGVWDTSTWEPGTPDDREFLAWLASMPPAQQRDIGSLGGIAANVTLVGAGSADIAADPSAEVRVSKIDILDGDDVTDRYAYWVADENMKVMLGVTDPWETDYSLEDAIPSAQAYWRLAAPQHTGAAVLFPGADPSEVRNGNIESRESLLISGNGHITRNEIKGLFHDITPHSYGVLANVRDGGLKQDLTAFLQAWTPRPEGSRVVEYSVFSNPVCPGFTGWHDSVGSLPGISRSTSLLDGETTITAPNLDANFAYLQSWYNRLSDDWLTTATADWRYPNLIINPVWDQAGMHAHGPVLAEASVFFDVSVINWSDPCFRTSVMRHWSSRIMFVVL